ncbi:MAG: glycosyltransferase family 4 protein [Pseudomonadota bacterium]
MSHVPLQKSHRLDIIVQRKLEVISSGNCAYLETFLTAAKAAGLGVRVIFAPWRSFENRPWASIHPRLEKLIDQVAWQSSIKLGHRYWSTSPRIWGRFGIRIVKEIMRRLGANIQIPTFFSTPLKTDERERVSAILKQDLADITVAEYSSLGPVLADLPKDETVHAVLMHDVLSDRGPALRTGNMIPNFVEMSAEEEVSWMSTSKLNFYASRNEMKSFGSRLPEAHNVWLRPNVPHFSEPPVSGPPRLIFIGTLHAANVDSVVHFHDEIWPKVRQELPEVELLIAGSTGPALPKRIQTAKGIKVLGRVDELADLGGPQSITIAPTRAATGISIKVAEYLLLRTACVAYPVAIAGFGNALEGLLEVHKTPNDFADAVIRLYKNEKLRHKLANKAGDNAPNCLSNAEVVAVLRNAVKCPQAKLTE